MEVATALSFLAAMDQQSIIKQDIWAQDVWAELASAAPLLPPLPRSQHCAMSLSVHVWLQARACMAGFMSEMQWWMFKVVW